MSQTLGSAVFAVFSSPIDAPSKKGLPTLCELVHRLWRGRKEIGLFPHGAFLLHFFVSTVLSLQGQIRAVDIPPNTSLGRSSFWVSHWISCAQLLYQSFWELLLRIRLSRCSVIFEKYNYSKQLLATDLLALATMKNAAKCDT